MILQGVMRDQEACEKFPNVLALFQMSSVFALGAMDCERIFSAHNLIKTPMRTGMDVKASAAQTRLLMLKHEMQFGSQEFEAFVAAVSVTALSAVCCAAVLLTSLQQNRGKMGFFSKKKWPNSAKNFGQTGSVMCVCVVHRQLRRSLQRTSSSASNLTCRSTKPWSSSARRWVWALLCICVASIL